MGLSVKWSLISVTFMDVVWGAVLFAWSLLCAALLSKRWYEFLVNRGVKKEKAIFSSRKFIHIWAAGLTSFAVPFLFSSPTVPFIASLILAAITYIPHKKDKLMDWFQIRGNIDEVYFLITWGFTLLAIWLIVGSPYPAVLPGIFLSVGDAIAGEVRNILYESKNKSIVGNIVMMVFNCIVGYLFFGFIGFVAGFFSALVEKFEIIDDDISVPLVSTIIIILGVLLG